MSIPILHVHVGIAGVSDSAIGSQCNDGRIQWEWKILSLEGSPQGPEGVEGVAHVIDLKGISKEDLYRVLDPITREWINRLFMHILRK